MKTVHELFTNARMEDSRFEYSWFYSWMVVCFAGVVARASCRVYRDIESLRGRMASRSSVALTSLSRYEIAPACRAGKTYSS